MQEVVKRLQERQEKPKKDIRYNLCLVRANGRIWPVVLPESVFGIKSGDIVFFAPDGIAIQGEVQFCESYCKEDDAVWTAVCVMSGIEPLAATRYLKAEELIWED